MSGGRRGIERSVVRLRFASRCRERWRQDQSLAERGRELNRLRPERRSLADGGSVVHGGRDGRHLGTQCAGRARTPRGCRDHAQGRSRPPPRSQPARRCRRRVGGSRRHHVLWRFVPLHPRQALHRLGADDRSYPTRRPPHNAAQALMGGGEALPPGVEHRRQKLAVCRDFEPSDGLEPWTPSLPWNYSGKRWQPTATIFGFPRFSRMRDLRPIATGCNHGAP
jgi:hypothetical protein